MIQIYRITITPSSTNAFSVGRTDTWTLQKDKLFTNFDEARNYVITQNCVHSELPRFLIDLPSIEEKETFIENFCFKETHLHLQRYFIGKPSKIKIQNSLKNIGINFITSD